MENSDTKIKAFFVVVVKRRNCVEFGLLSDNKIVITLGYPVRHNITHAVFRKVSSTFCMDVNQVQCGLKVTLINDF